MLVRFGGVNEVVFWVVFLVILIGLVLLGLIGGGISILIIGVFFLIICVCWVGFMNLFVNRKVL